MLHKQSMHIKYFFPSLIWQFVIDDAIGSNSANTLAELLKDNKTLTQLCANKIYGTVRKILKDIYDIITRNKINDEFSKNPLITELDLRGTNITFFFNWYNDTNNYYRQRSGA